VEGTSSDKVQQHPAASGGGFDLTTLMVVLPLWRWARLFRFLSILALKDEVFRII